MICPTCSERIAEPEMQLGGAWLWRCRCGKATIAPAQQRRGQVIRAGLVEAVVEASGTCES